MRGTQVIATALPPRRRAGITLFELLVVIVIIGILAGLAASRLDWMRYRAESVGRGVMADLALAQRTAVSLQMDVRVSRVSNTTLRIHEDADDDGSIDSGERVTYSQLENGFTFDKGSLTALPSPAAGAELTALVFRRDGTASTSGAFYIRGPARDSACAYCRAVEILRTTGRATVYSYATGSWVRGN